MTLDDLCQLLDRVQGFGDRRKALCPAHPDDVASLSLRQTDDGKILLNCQAGCQTTAVVAALGLAMKDLFMDVKAREVSRQNYTDANGKLLYAKVRYEPKDFRVEPQGYNGPRVPYRLPELLANPSRRVLWVEGEKDADRLWREGFLATTSGGSTSFRPEIAEHLAGRHVTIVPDNDDAGRMYARQVGEALAQVALSVSICELPGLPAKGDVSDYLQTHSREDLMVVLKTAPAFDDTKADGDLLSGLKQKPVEFAWFPRIPAVGLTFIYGEAGLGKSTFAIDLLSRLSRGDRMPMGVEKKDARRIVALGFEDDIEGTVVGRFNAAKADGDMVLIERPSKYPNPHEPLIPGQIEWLKSEIRRHQASVVFIDNIENALTGKLDSNNSLSIRSALSPLVEMAQLMNVAIIALHHPKKGFIHGSAKEGMTGSQAYTNIARSTMEAIPVPGVEELYALAAVKVNGYPKRIPTLTYRLSETVSGMQDGHETFEAATVVWGRETDLSADELHRETVRVQKEQQDGRRGGWQSTQDARAFFARLPWAGGLTWSEIVTRGRDDGFSEIGLRRARVGILEFSTMTKFWHPADALLMSTAPNTKSIQEHSEHGEHGEHGGISPLMDPPSTYQILDGPELTCVLSSEVDKVSKLTPSIILDEGTSSEVDNVAKSPVPPVPTAPQSVQERMARFLAAESTEDFIKRLDGTSQGVV